MAAVDSGVDTVDGLEVLERLPCLELIRDFTMAALEVIPLAETTGAFITMDAAAPFNGDMFPWNLFKSSCDRTCFVKSCALLNERGHF